MVVGSDAISIAQGQNASFIYPQEKYGWKLRVNSGGREWHFTMPKSLDGYPWIAYSDAGIHAQIEPDLRICLVMPSDVGVVDLGIRGQNHVSGFPLSPIGYSLPK